MKNRFELGNKKRKIQLQPFCVYTLKTICHTTAACRTHLDFPLDKKKVNSCTRFILSVYRSAIVVRKSLKITSKLYHYGFAFAKIQQKNFWQAFSFTRKRIFRAAAPIDTFLLPFENQHHTHHSCTHCDQNRFFFALKNTTGLRIFRRRSNENC